MQERLYVHVSSHPRSAIKPVGYTVSQNEAITSPVRWCCELGKAFLTLTEQAREYAATATAGGLSRLAMDLGVTVDSLQAFQVGWSNHHRAWTHPMRDVSSRVTGIRLRKPDGNKFSVKGGKEALFLPSAWPSDCTILLVTEGASDALAAFTMGFLAVAGRPSCTGGRPHIVALVRQHNPALVAIVADQDAPGQRGAVELASRLALHCRDVRVVTPPSKDLRAWLLSGATATDLQQLIHSATKHKLQVTSGAKS
jgi:hypothetical protein